MFSLGNNQYTKKKSKRESKFTWYGHSLSSPGAMLNISDNKINKRDAEAVA